MAKITIIDTDTHAATLDGGTVLFTFKILSHADFNDYLSRPVHELLNVAVVSVSGLEIEQDGVAVAADDVKAALIAYPPLANWANHEYLTFWQKKSPDANLAYVARWWAGLERVTASPGIAPSMLATLKSAGWSDAAIAAWAGTSHPVTQEIKLHPDNAAVFYLLVAAAGCFVMTERGLIVGFRYADAQPIADWNGVDSDERKRLPIAINAILRGKDGNQ